MGQALSVLRPSVLTRAPAVDLESGGRPRIGLVQNELHLATLRHRPLIGVRLGKHHRAEKLEIFHHEAAARWC